MNKPPVVLETNAAPPGIRIKIEGGDTLPVVCMALLAVWNEREGKFDKYVDYLAGDTNGAITPAQYLPGFSGVVFPG